MKIYEKQIIFDRKLILRLLCLKMIIQFPTEYQTSPVLKWSKVVWFANGLVFKWNLNTGLKSPLFEWLGCVITILMLRNCHSYVVPFEIRTRFQMVQPFEYWTLKSLVLR